MQLKVYRRDNRKKDQRDGRRAWLRFGAALGLVLAAFLLYHLSGPLVIAAASLREFVLENPYFSAPRT